MIVGDVPPPPTRTSLLAKVGLTFTGWRGPPKLFGFALFAFFFVATDYWTKMLVRSAFADAALAAMPVPVEHVPFLVAAALVALTLATGLTPIALLSLLSPTGYDNNQPRVMKSIGMAQTYPVLFRVQCAHNNSLEFLAMVAPCLWAARELEMERPLFAKLTLCMLGTRLLYVLAYVLNEDLVRTTCFLLSVTALLDLGFGAVFPALLDRYHLS